MNKFQKITLSSLLSAFAVASVASASETNNNTFSQESTLNTDKCISEVMSLEGRSVEEFAEWIELVGKSINMQVTPYTSLTNSGLKMLKLEDDYHGSHFTMHLKDKYCYITENSFESLSPLPLKEAPEKDNSFKPIQKPKVTVGP